MDTVPIITAGSIKTIKAQEEHPVYFLTLTGSQELVVKAEAAVSDPASIKWSSKLMKHVSSPLVNTKLMTREEIAVVKAALFHKYPPARPPAPANSSPQRARFLAMETTHKWVKMPKVAGLSDAEFLTHSGAPNVEKITASIVKLSSDSAWTELGKVVAVDIFNGNDDRFRVTTDRTPFAGSEVPLGTCTNEGNIMFVAGGPISIIGLDTYHPVGDHSNLSDRRQNDELLRLGQFDELRILIHPQIRNAFAQLCVKSVGHKMWKALTKGMVKSLFIRTQRQDGVTLNTFLPVNEMNMDRLFAPYDTSFATGIALGAERLKGYLLTKVLKNPPLPFRPMMGTHRGPPPPPGKAIPQGILARMRFLGWLAADPAA